MNEEKIIKGYEALIYEHKKEKDNLKAENADLLTTIMQQDKELLALEEAKAFLQKENAELKARLEKSVELPCKVGDNVYYTGVYRQGQKIEEYPPIVRFVISNDDNYAISDDYYFEFKHFGKLYFTSKEEAEKALKEEGNEI